MIDMKFLPSSDTGISLCKFEHLPARYITNAKIIPCMKMVKYISNIVKNNFYDFYRLMLKFPVMVWIQHHVWIRSFRNNICIFQSLYVTNYKISDLNHFPFIFFSRFQVCFHDVGTNFDDIFTKTWHSNINIMVTL